MEKQNWLIIFTIKSVAFRECDFGYALVNSKLAPMDISSYFNAQGGIYLCPLRFRFFFIFLKFFFLTPDIEFRFLNNKCWDLRGNFFAPKGSKGKAFSTVSKLVSSDINLSFFRFAISLFAYLI